MPSAPENVPDHPPHSGEALQLAGCFAEAEAAYKQQLAKTPDDARTLSNYGGLLCALCAFEPALELLSRAVQLAPDLADAWSNLGNALQSLQCYGEAIGAYSQCLRLNPHQKFALSNLGVALDCIGQHAQAQNFHRTAVKLDPENAESHTNYALSLLAQGNYPDGFAEYEWRWKTRTTGAHGFSAPLWKGEKFPGKTLLVHTEGGFGDMLQFSRFLPALIQFGGDVVVRVRPELLTLLSHSFPQIPFISENEPAPPHDLQCPILSLPLALGSTLATLPSSEGFLHPDPDKVRHWAEALRQDDPDHRNPLRIGLVWAGAPHSEIREAEIADRRRSTTLATLAPLAAAAPDAVFYSLQVGDQAFQANSPPAGMRLIDHTDKLKNFEDTAALIANLDLVIAVDTSTAHVAAGLGKPVWLLSRFDQCWRWLSGKTDSPWYDSVRLYQQDKPLDWSGPIARACADLRTFDARHHQDRMAALTTA